LFSVFWGLVNALFVRKVKTEECDDTLKIINACIDKYKKDDEYYVINPDEEKPKPAKEVLHTLNECGTIITKGAVSFLNKEYLYLTIWSFLFAIVLGCTVDLLEMRNKDAPTDFPYTAVSYLIGSVTSIIAGYIGMRIAVYTNTRVTFQCALGATRDKDGKSNVHEGFLTAFSGGEVLGFVLVGLALLNLMIIVLIYRAAWWLPSAEGIWKGDLHKGLFTELKLSSGTAAANTIYMTAAHETDYKVAISVLTRRLFELVAGYGLGGSSVALFGRVGGGIYTKAADVGADLVGKNLHDLKEDDINNPGTIADNVGDNVGDIAGMGSDLFGSLAESTCAALVVSATSVELIQTPDALFFPLSVTASGVIASFVSVLAIYCASTSVENVQRVLISQIALSTVLMTGTVLPAMYLLPESFTFLGGANKEPLEAHRWTCFGCVMFGLWSGMIIGFVTDYYTNNRWNPTLRLADSCKDGPAPNIILGIALGYQSCVIPILCITATIGYAFHNAGMYGIGLSALGMLGSLPVALSVDGYGPIADNAGGIAEMCGLPAEIRRRTDALDAAGNTTAAVGKGFAIGSACLVGLALFGAFITRIDDTSVDILKPTQFAGLLVGAMLPYAFSALTMTAVGDAAYKMMQFIIADYEKG
jgi:inorganic pyrophosphatase